MDIFNIKKLNVFVEYCDSIINSIDEDEDFDLWLVYATNKNATIEEYLESVKITMETYYHWIDQAVQIEDYEAAMTIKIVEEMEAKHFIKLAHYIFKKSLRKEITAIINELKEKYIIK